MKSNIILLYHRIFYQWHGCANFKLTTGSCRGICTRFRPKDVSGHNKYAQGQKRCTECMVFLDYNGKHCPCCGTVLRTKPRNPKLKRRMEQLMLQKKSEVAN